MSKKAAVVATPRAWKTMTMSLGPISVQIGLKPLIREEKLSARMLCPEHMTPVKMAWTCGFDGAQVEPVKRYEHGGVYVEVDSADFESESDASIVLTAAPDTTSIDTCYFEKPYLIWPRPGFEGQFDMIAAAVEQSGKTLIGTTVMTKSTRVFAVRWSETFGTLVAYVLTYDENVDGASVELVVDAASARPAPQDAYVEMLGQLIDTLPDEFDPAEYTDDYRDRLRAAIEAAASGAPIPKPVEESAPAVDVVDLMEALRATVAQAKKPAAKSATRKPAASKPASKPATARKKVAR